MKYLSGLEAGDGNIGLVGGPCSGESYEQTMTQADSIYHVKDVVEPFGIVVAYREGLWKPRTKSHDKNGNGVFEGVGVKGMPWLKEVAEKYEMSIVSECMSEEDIKHFEKYLEPERDYIQVGARTNQAYALLYRVGLTPFNVLLKTPMQGIKVDDSVGSLMRLENNGSIIYCVRGQELIPPDGNFDGSYRAYVEDIMKSEDQDPDARNFNNVEWIRFLKEDPDIKNNGILLGYDPSHTFGGLNDRMRRKIGEQGLKSIMHYGYDVLHVEVHDWPSYAKTDGYQALLTTTNGIDWSVTNGGQIGKNLVKGGGKEPEIMPLTLVDIASELVKYQAGRRGMSKDDAGVQEALRKLEDMRWQMAPVVSVSI